MTTLSVPINTHFEEFIKSYIENGGAETRAGVVRKALRILEEEEIMNNLLKAQQEYKDGKTLKGDLRELLKKIPNK